MASRKASLIEKLAKVNKTPQRLRSKKLIESESETKSSYFSPSNSNKSNIKQKLKESVQEKNKKQKVKREIFEETVKEENISPVKKVKLSNKINNDKKVDKKNNESDGKIQTSEEIENDKWEPLNWKKMLDNIRTMRSESSAPVDTMGCSKCYDENATEKEKRFNILLALMLSPRTKDEVTYNAMNRLKNKIIPLSPENVLQINNSVFEELIKPVGFYKNKTKYIYRTSQILVEKYDSDIPDSLENLMSLPGISSKIAHICMNAAWNIVTGIGVDVHVHRISNRLKWVKKETKTPEDTRVQLESWAPKELWSEINHLLVGFGQTICQAIKPKCDSCLNKNICPYVMGPGAVPKKSIKKKDLDW